MKKLALAAALVIVGLVGACLGTGTPEERADRQGLLTGIAIAQIKAFNAEGVDPLQLSPVKLQALNSACLIATAVLASTGNAPGSLAVVRACKVIVTAAAPAVPMPVPRPVPQ